MSKQLWEQTITQQYLFMYKKPRDGKKKKKIEKSISLELQGVNWRAITKERQASNPKEKEEQERRMD